MDAGDSAAQENDGGEVAANRASERATKETVFTGEDSLNEVESLGCHLDSRKRRTANSWSKRPHIPAPVVTRGRRKKKNDQASERTDGRTNRRNQECSLEDRLEEHELPAAARDIECLEKVVRNQAEINPTQTDRRLTLLVGLQLA